ncbi:MAG TPA: hypothetical protein VHW03_06645 [Chthoniobacterales bacterium]|nr:hypothetical protein [Chthoniobacterales bacterium]
MRLKIFVLLIPALCCIGGVVSAGSKPESTSTSRQFIVYGADVQVRGAVCDLAEATKNNLLQLLDLPDGWRTSIVVNLDYPQANFPEMALSRLDFSQTGAGLKLQLNLLLADGLDTRMTERELLRAILLEMMYRSRPGLAVGTRYSTPPDWLLDGILALTPRRDSDEATQLLQAIVADNRIAPLETVVRQRRDLLDPPSQEIHDAYSMALVQLLLDAPDGRRKLAQYITDLPDAPNDSYADLRAHFPLTLGGGAEKSWELSVARVSARDRYEILSAEETARRLDRLLRLSVPGRDGQPHEYSLGNFRDFLQLPGARAALRDLSEQLLLLGSRAHPSYQKIVQEYYQLTTLLARGKTEKAPQRLRRLASYRALVDRQSRGIDDYMNWYEATQLDTMSGAFSDSLANTATDTPLRRRDAISVYLDTIEAQMK